jgi:nicotinate-nucleotide adenylyltransferase
MRPIGVFGGMFDPVHHGHLRPALEVAEALALETVRVVPCGEPPHRAAPHASAALRRRLLAAAIADEPRFMLDPRELERPGPHYTVDTLAALRAELGPDRPLVLLLGADALGGLDRWHRWTELPTLAHLAVMRRPGHSLPEVGPVAELVAARLAAAPTELGRAPAGMIWIQDVTRLEVSSTDLRARLARGASARWLVPDAAWELMRQSGAYRTDGEG